MVGRDQRVKDVQSGTAAPGYDAETDPQADGRRGRKSGRSAVTADPVRVHARPARWLVVAKVAHAPTTAAAVAEQHEPLQRDDTQLVPARPHHPAGAKGHQSAGCGFLHLRVSVDAVFRTQPVAIRVPQLRGERQQGRGGPGHVAGIRQFHGQSGVLHHIQQGVSAGVQTGVDVQVPRPQQKALVAAAAAHPEGLTGTPRARFPSVLRHHVQHRVRVSRNRLAPVDL